MNGHFMMLENRNQVLKLNNYSPMACVIWLCSDANYVTMSVSEYLTKYEGFHMKNVAVEYPALERQRYHVLSKTKLTVKADDVNVILKPKLRNNIYLLRHIRVKIIEHHEGDHTAEHDERPGIHIHGNERTITLLDYNKLTLCANRSYIVTPAP
jgi:hypothetical protein